MKSPRIWELHLKINIKFQRVFVEDSINPTPFLQHRPRPTLLGTWAPVQSHHLMWLHWQSVWRRPWERKESFALGETVHLKTFHIIWTNHMYHQFHIIMDTFPYVYVLVSHRITIFWALSLTLECGYEFVWQLSLDLPNSAPSQPRWLVSTCIPIEMLKHTHVNMYPKMCMFYICFFKSQKIYNSMS